MLAWVQGVACCKCRAYTICKVWELRTECLRYVVALNPEMWELVVAVYRCALCGVRHWCPLTMLPLTCCLTVVNQGAHGADGAAPTHRRGASRCATDACSCLL